MNAHLVIGKFSDVAGSRVRRVFDGNRLIGTITKRDDGGYRVYRVVDGKVKEKAKLEDAFKAVKRAN